MKVKSESEIAQLCLTLSDPMDCSPPGFSIHGIFQARVLEWGAIAFSGNYTAAAAKSLQSCLTLCDAIDGSPPGSPIPGILHAGTLEWVAISFSNVWKWKVKVKSLSRVQLSVTLWTAAYQPPPSMGFSRQEYWSELPLPSPSSSQSWVHIQPLCSLKKKIPMLDPIPDQVIENPYSGVRAFILSGACEWFQ